MPTEDPSTQPKPVKQPASLGNMDVDGDGFLADIKVQALDEDTEARDEKRHDVGHFFTSPTLMNIKGKESMRCRCRLCLDKKSIVNEVTTLRRHMEAHHSGKYRKWTQENKFESRLPGDIKKRKAAAEVITPTLDRDLKKFIKYTDKAFLQAAIEWLVATD